MPPALGPSFYELRLDNVPQARVRLSAATYFAFKSELALASSLEIHQTTLSFPIVERINGRLGLVDCTPHLDRVAQDTNAAFSDPLRLGCMEVHDAPSARYLLYNLVRDLLI